MEPMSSVRYLQENVQLLIDAEGSIKQLCEASGLNYDTIKRMQRGISCRLTTVDRLARYAGKSIGEMFLKPGLETAWYDDTRLEYLSKNLDMVMCDLDLKELSAALEMPTSAVEKILNNEVKPMTRTLGKLAEALNEEVADLFLPPEGE